MNAEQRRLVREARDANQRQRLARANMTERRAARAARQLAQHIVETETRPNAAEHIPLLSESELEAARLRVHVSKEHPE